MASSYAGPLAGLKVVDLTVWQNGPSATAQMADNGATVVKLEPAAGDPIRHLSRPGEVNNGLEAFNRGKLGVTIDLKHPDAHKVMRKLVEWADVLCENFRPGVLDRLGYSYQILSQWNPAIIYASNSGFGDRGVWAQRPSFDLIAQSFAGAATAMGGGPSHPPGLVEWTFSDEVGAMNFYGSILAALFARSMNGGRGQQLTTSQVGATLHFQRASVQRSLQMGMQRDDGLPPGSGSGIGQKMHRAGDEKYFAVSIPTPTFFDRFVTDVLGMPHLKDRPPNLEEQIALRVATQPRKHWVARCAAADVPCAPANSYADIGDTSTSVGSHFAANGYLVGMQHRSLGTMTVVPPPTRHSHTSHDDDYIATLADQRGGGGGGAAAAEGSQWQHRQRLRSWHAPLIGEHSAMVLHTIGFSPVEARAMMVEGGAVPPAKGKWANAVPRL